MKFLIITQFFPPEMGAPQTRLSEFSQNLIKLGHEVEVVTALPNYPHGQIFPDYKGKFYVKDTYKGIPVHRIWLYAAQGKSIQRLLCYLSFMGTALYGIFVAKKADYIFVNSGPLFLSLTGKIYSFFWNRPTIFSVADLWPRSVEHLNASRTSLAMKLALYLEAWSYRNANYITAVTEGIREVLIKEKNIPTEKVLFLPNGVNTQLYLPDPNKKSLSKIRSKLNAVDKTIFVYSGNHGFAHSLDNVLQAAKLIQDEATTNLSLKKILILFIGDGSDKARLVQLKTDLNLQNVMFLPPVSQEELVEYLEVSDVGLINVKNSELANETRPAKMFPMMAMEKPILYAGFGEGSKIIESCKGGVIVAPENSEALKTAIINFFSGAYDLKQMGLNNRKYVIENLQFKNLVQDWLTKLLGKNSKSQKV